MWQYRVITLLKVEQGIIHNQSESELCIMYIHHEAKLSCVCHHTSRSEAE